MRALLEYEAMADPNTEERFGRWARGECRDTRFEVDLAIARKMGRYFWLSRYGKPSLGRFFKEAAKLEKAGSYMEAAKIYKDLTESLGVHMDLIPDKGGYCQFYMAEALENIAKCVMAAELDDEGRRLQIRYLADWSIRVIDWFGEDYAKTLSSICQDEEDLKVWEHILDNPPQVEPHYSGPSSVSIEAGRESLAARRREIGR